MRALPTQVAKEQVCQCTKSESTDVKARMKTERKVRGEIRTTTRKGFDKSKSKHAA